MVINVTMKKKEDEKCYTKSFSFITFFGHVDYHIWTFSWKSWIVSYVSRIITLRMMDVFFGKGIHMPNIKSKFARVYAPTHIKRVFFCNGMFITIVGKRTQSSDESFFFIAYQNQSDKQKGPFVIGCADFFDNVLCDLNIEYVSIRNDRRFFNHDHFHFR